MLINTKYTLLYQTQLFQNLSYIKSVFTVAVDQKPIEYIEVTKIFECG